MVKSYTRYELNRTIGVIASHSNSIFIEPDSKEAKKSAGRVITACLEEILVWDIKTGEILQRLHDGMAPGSLNSTSQNPPAQTVSLAYEPITNVLASGYSDGSIKIWDLTSGVVLINFQGHRSAVSMLSLIDPAPDWFPVLETPRLFFGILWERPAYLSWKGTEIK